MGSGEGGGGTGDGGGGPWRASLLVEKSKKKARVILRYGSSSEFPWWCQRVRLVSLYFTRKGNGELCGL